MLTPKQTTLYMYMYILYGCTEMCSEIHMTLQYYVFIVESADGHVVAVKCNPAAPTELLVKLKQAEVDVIKQLQLQMVSVGYTVRSSSKGQYNVRQLYATDNYSMAGNGSGGPRGVPWNPPLGGLRSTDNRPYETPLSG